MNLLCDTGATSVLGSLMLQSSSLFDPIDDFGDDDDDHDHDHDDDDDHDHDHDDDDDEGDGDGDADGAFKDMMKNVFRLGDTQVLLLLLQ